MAKKIRKPFFPKKFSRKQVLYVILTSVLLSAFGVSAWSQNTSHGSFVSPAIGAEEYTEATQLFDNKSTVDPFVKGQVILHGDRTKKKIALTFDAEMTESMRENYLDGTVTSSYDSRIIDALLQTHTKATFFLTGMWIQLYPQVASFLGANSLFELGSHSYADTSYTDNCFGLPLLANTLKIEDIGATQKLLRQVAHINNHLFRFPGGCYSKSDVALVNQTGDIVVHWDVAGEDGFTYDTLQIEQNILNHVQNGSIIVLHLNGAPTAPVTWEVVPVIIDALKKSGYTFVTVSELLHLPEN